MSRDIVFYADSLTDMTSPADIFLFILQTPGNMWVGVRP